MVQTPGAPKLRFAETSRDLVSRLGTCREQALRLGDRLLGGDLRLLETIAVQQTLGAAQSGSEQLRLQRLRRLTQTERTLKAGQRLVIVHHLHLSNAKVNQTEQQMISPCLAALFSGGN